MRSLRALRVIAACGVAALLGGCGTGHGSDRPAIHGARLAFVLADFVRIPPSASEPPQARINALIAAPDESHRLFVNDLRGKIWIIRGDSVMPQPLLDMAAARPDDFLSKELFEQGLNTFAFHPDFARAGTRGFGKIYTFSTERPSDARLSFAGRLDAIAPAHHDVVAEWSVSGDRVDIASRREILRIAHPLHDHVGGQIGFDPNARPGDADYGLLYIGVGDGGNTVFRNNQVDEWRTAQDPGLPLGKILRIDPLADGSRPYRVPADNPFAHRSGALPEIWALGLRNPARFSWDRGAGGKLVIADIGQMQQEELDVGSPGANYGWSEREGRFTVAHGDQSRHYGLPIYESLSSYAGPALAYGHHVGIAITGGFVYRGSALPQLRGMYVFGDIATGKVFAASAAQLVNGDQAPFYELRLSYQGRERSLLDVVKAQRADLRLGIDDDGEIYVLTKQDGAIRKLTGTVPSDIAMWPVEHPVRLLDYDSWWGGARDRISATVEDLSQRAKRWAGRV